MLNSTLHISENIFDKDVEKKPTRHGFGEGLVEAGRADERVVALCADLTESTRIPGPFYRSRSCRASTRYNRLRNGKLR